VISVRRLGFLAHACWQLDPAIASHVRLDLREVEDLAQRVDVLRLIQYYDSSNANSNPRIS